MLGWSFTGIHISNEYPSSDEILHLGVSKEKLLHRHPPGGNSVMFGVLKFLNAYEENWNWDPNNSGTLEHK